MIDNSGAKTVECLKILGGYKKKYANLNDLIIVSIKTLKTNKNYELNIKRKGIFKGTIIQTKTYRTKFGIKFKFNENAIILLNNQLNPLGTRFFGFAVNTKQNKFYKFKTISLNMAFF